MARMAAYLAAGPLLSVDPAGPKLVALTVLRFCHLNTSAPSEFTFTVGQRIEIIVRERTSIGHSRRCGVGSTHSSVRAAIRELKSIFRGPCLGTAPLDEIPETYRPAGIILSGRALCPFTDQDAPPADDRVLALGLSRARHMLRLALHHPQTRWQSPSRPPSVNTVTRK